MANKISAFLDDHLSRLLKDMRKSNKEMTDKIIMNMATATKSNKKFALYTIEELQDRIIHLINMEDMLSSAWDKRKEPQTQQLIDSDDQELVDNLSAITSSQNDPDDPEQTAVASQSHEVLKLTDLLKTLQKKYPELSEKTLYKYMRQCNYNVNRLDVYIKELNGNGPITVPLWTFEEDVILTSTRSTIDQRRALMKEKGYDECIYRQQLLFEKQQRLFRELTK